MDRSPSISFTSSLNDQLLQGPDFLDSLLRIQIRFRKERVAVVADIESMIHSFLLEESCRDHLRFLWHKDNILENPFVTYRLRTHAFGNKLSPSIAMYDLQRIGKLNAESNGHEVRDFIMNDFYLDDGLKQAGQSNMKDVDLQRQEDPTIIKDFQNKVYSNEINCWRASKPLNKDSPIHKLDPYIDTEGLLRVRGRLKNSNLDTSFKHPVILTAKQHVVTLMVRKLHEDVKYQGRHFTEGHIRSSGYWIVGGKRLVFNHIQVRYLQEVKEGSGFSENVKLARVPHCSRTTSIFHTRR